MLLKNESYPIWYPLRITVRLSPNRWPSHPFLNEGEYAMPIVGAQLFLSGLTLFGSLYGPASVTGLTLNSPVNAAVLIELIGSPKYSYLTPRVSVRPSFTRQRSWKK